MTLIKMAIGAVGQPGPTVGDVGCVKHFSFLLLLLLLLLDYKYTPVTLSNL